MTRDAQASLRMPKNLKEEIKKIADVEHRTLSNTIELLLKNAVNDYWKSNKALVEVSTDLVNLSKEASQSSAKQRKAG